MAYRLGAAASAASHRLQVFDSLDSTNTEALARARSGDGGPLWIVTRRQEAGRGRRGNAWVSPPGNLAASLLLSVDDVDPAQVASLGFVAGVALVEAVDEVTEARVRLKWPNDVLLAGAKLAGILLEAESPPGGRRVVIGIGVNVAAAPEGLPYPATCLRQGEYGVAAESVFECLSDRLADAIELWDRGRGFAGIRERWLARAAGLGAPLSVWTGRESVQGIFETIDEAGRLVIRSDDGMRRTVTAGEVHFGTAATAA